jgi:hypothetical protein
MTCAICRRGDAVKLASLERSPEEEAALYRLAAAFPGLRLERWPICGTCLTQARRTGVHLALRRLQRSNP